MMFEAYPFGHFMHFRRAEVDVDNNNCGNYRAAKDEHREGKERSWKQLIFYCFWLTNDGDTLGGRGRHLGDHSQEDSHREEVRNFYKGASGVAISN